jgi:osmotically inducible protein OsmC
VGIELNLKAEVEGIEETKFQEIANNAKKNCPISQALSTLDIKLNASLV